MNKKSFALLAALTAGSCCLSTIITGGTASAAPLGSVGMPNPMKAYDSVAEAKAAAGFQPLYLPSMTGYVDVPAARARAEELLAKVGLADRLGHLPAELSGGEQQRVALARALMCRPRLVLADEPTGNLDRLTGAEIMRLLFEVNGDPLAVVMVTHSAEAAAMCDRTLTLEKGRLAGAENDKGE